MGIDRHGFKHIVAAFVLLLGFSAPGAAETDRLDSLFTDLKTADTEQAARIEAQIRDAWSRSGSPAMDLLLRRGSEALEAGEAWEDETINYRKDGSAFTIEWKIAPVMDGDTATHYVAVQRAID